MEITQIAQQVRQLFLSHKLEDCIELSKQIDNKESDKDSYQFAQIYKGMSLALLSQEQLSKECFSSLFEFSQKNKQGKVNELDVLTYTFYQWKQYDLNKEEAIDFNNKLLQICTEYKNQSENTQSYNDGIYHLGMCVFSFIQELEEEQHSQYLQSIIYKDIKNQFQDEILYLLGWRYSYLEDKAEEAIKWFQVLEKINPNYPGLASNLGIMHDIIEDHSKAEEYYLKASQINPKNEEALRNLAILYQNTDQLEKAQEQYNKLIIANPNNVESYLYYSGLLCEINKEQEASEVLSQGLQFNPNSIEILTKLLKLEVSLGNNDKQKEYLDKMVETDPEDGIFEYNYASSVLEKGQFQRALEYFKKALSKQLPKQQIYFANSKLSFIYFKLYGDISCLNQSFYACNMDIPYCDFDDDLEGISHLLNSVDSIPLQEKIESINAQFGIIQTRFQKIIENTKNLTLKNTLLEKQSCFRTILSILAFKSHILPLISLVSQNYSSDLLLE